jgi:uncharacterized membrane protein YkvA (DUF1232 family)
MNVTPLHASPTCHGCFDFLNMKPRDGHRVGAHELRPGGLDRFNAVLHALSPDSPALNLDQMAWAAQRALERHPDGSQPAFVTSRMNALARLECLAEDPGWEADEILRGHLHAARSYVQSCEDLIPDELPVVGRLDDAVLIDVLLHLLREELAEYEDFCRFRQVAAEFADVAVADTGLTRSHWLEALTSVPGGRVQPRLRRIRTPFAPDPRSALFQIT